VIDASGRIVGFLDEAEVTLAYLNATNAGTTRAPSVIVEPPPRA